jgi:2-oxoglutarate dehydrogenase E2 component (dihydrolipoamide succinyltransferase)
MPHKTVMLLPEIDKHTSEVEIAFWLKKDGSFIAKHEAICEVNTEEFAFELEAQDAGILKILVSEGSMVKTGEAICEILTE